MKRAFNDELKRREVVTMQTVEPPALARTVFATSRALDFCSRKELVAQCGHEPADWPLVILKELLDNALDAGEEAGVAPVVGVVVNADGVTITDNGPGIAESTIRRITDFSVRVSSREAYVAPDRGKQGNALKTVLAMPFVLDGDAGTVEITTGGVVYNIEMKVDGMRSEPVITITTEPSNVQIGTSIKVLWPDSACSNLELLYEAKPRFLQMAADACCLNPHLSLTVDWFDEQLVDIPAGAAGWRKWRPNEPTSAHWYEPESLARLIGAYLAHDADAGRQRSVREFISEFRGLARTGKQKAVAADSGLTGAALADLVVDGALDKKVVEKLLLAMQAESKPIKAAKLGIIGRDGLARQMLLLGCAADTFEYRKCEGTIEGLPWVVEAAFAVHASAYSGEPAGRRIITGVNWSASIIDPFRSLGQWGLGALLKGQRAGGDEPIVVALHFACPRIDYLDRGKSSVKLPAAVDKAVVDAITAITAKWCKTRKAEEREAASAARRSERMSRPRRRWTQVDAAGRVMEQAYLAASANGTLPAHARQIMYQARGPMQALVGKVLGKGFDRYFTQTLLPNYMAEYPEQTERWDIVFDARGHLTEPHTGLTVPLGTIAVRDYLADTKSGMSELPGAARQDTHSYPTSGPRHRYGAIMFIEKEGFMPLFEAVHLAERYDIAIMSTKGMSTTASRLLVDRLCAEHDVPLLVVHDFDKSGFIIASTLQHSTRRYEFTAAHADRVVDLGLRLEDVEALDLPAEEVLHGRSDPTDNLIENGATPAEVKFLCRGHEDNKGGYWGERVELNAFTSDALVAWIEGKLDGLGIGKVVPAAATLERAFRRAAKAHYINRHIDEVEKAAKEHAEQLEVPADLGARVRERLQHDPRTPWDMAIGTLAGVNKDGTGLKAGSGGFSA